jgi:hypothetical protein
MDSEIEREKKQEYLRKEILESNYDTNEFLSFLISKYGDDAADIDQYTFDELSKIISDFKLISKPVDGNYEPEDEDLRKISSENSNNHITNNKEGENYLQPPSDDINYKKIKVEKYEDVFEGEKMALSEISFQEISVLISKPEKKDGGLFSRAYITYLITTTPFNFEVRRRYSDFEWLRSILADHFPAFLIPPIPLKNFSDRFNDEFLDKRKRYLQKFLNSICANPTLSSSMFFYDFLTIKNEGEWTNKKKAYNKIKVPTKLAEMKTIDGSVS